LVVILSQTRTIEWTAALTDVSRTWLRYVWLMAWQIRLSVVCDWRACTLLMYGI